MAEGRGMQFIFLFPFLEGERRQEQMVKEAFALSLTNPRSSELVINLSIIVLKTFINEGVNGSSASIPDRSNVITVAWLGALSQ